MLLKIIGDIHGEYDVFHLDELKADLPFTAIQIGDFGFYPGAEYMDRWIPTEYPLYFIDGNHEHFRYLKDECESVMQEPDGTYQLRENLFYIPRGTILTFGSAKIGFLGGAESVDKAWRRERESWFHEERITEEDVEKFKNREVDLLITHSPPANFIKRNFSPINREYWRLPPTWEDISSQRVEQVWGMLGMPRIISGHFHKSIVDGQGTILNINEVLDIHVEDE